VKAKIRFTYTLIAIFVIGITLVLSGCMTLSSTWVYPSDKFKDKDNFKNILVLVEASWGYGQWYNKKSFTFCQASSQQIMDKYVGHIEPVFLQKGYNVIDVIPVGLIFLDPVNRIRFPDPYIVKDFEAKELVSIPAEQDQFVYTYQSNLSELEVEAARRLLVEYGKAAAADNFKDSRLSLEDLKTIADKRGADIICIANIFGHSDIGNVGDIIAGIITAGPFGLLSSISKHYEVFYAAIIDVETGEIVFLGVQHGRRLNEDYQERIIGALRKLPSRIK